MLSMVLLNSGGAKRAHPNMQALSPHIHQRRNRFHHRWGRRVYPACAACLVLCCGVALVVGVHGAHLASERATYVAICAPDHHHGQHGHHHPSSEEKTFCRGKTLSAEEKILCSGKDSLQRKNFCRGKLSAEGNKYLLMKKLSAGIKNLCKGKNLSAEEKTLSRGKTLC